MVVFDGVGKMMMVVMMEVLSTKGGQAGGIYRFWLHTRKYLVDHISLTDAEERLSLPFELCRGVLT